MQVWPVVDADPEQHDCLTDRLTIGETDPQRILKRLKQRNEFRLRDLLTHRFMEHVEKGEARLNVA